MPQSADWVAPPNLDITRSCLQPLWVGNYRLFARAVGAFILRDLPVEVRLCYEEVVFGVAELIHDSYLPLFFACFVPPFEPWWRY